MGADSAALSLRVAQDRITIPLAKAAAAFIKVKGWTDFGFARLDDHARERFGCTGRSLRDLAAIGRGVSSKGPALARAITGEDGGPPIGRVAARLILRVSTKRSLASWIRLSRFVSVRKLRDLVRLARDRKSRWPLVDNSQSLGTDHGLEVLGGDGRAMPSPDESRNDLSELNELHEDDTSCEDHDDIRLKDQVGLPVPAPVLSAFDEGLDLFRAVVGTRAPASSFVDALVAEASTGVEPPRSESIDPLTFLHRLQPGDRKADAEARLAGRTGHWEHLPDVPPLNEDTLEGAFGAAVLDRLRIVSLRAGFGEAPALDKQMRSLLSIEDNLGRRLGRLLTDMAGRAAWTRLGFTDVEHYAEQRLGMSRTSARERVSVERGLRRLPVIREAYEEGDISIQAALRVIRSIGRTPIDESAQHAWVDRARRSTVKRLDDEFRLIRRLRGYNGPTSGLTDPQPVPLDDRTWHRSLGRSAGTARHRFSRMAHAGMRDTSANVFLRLRLDPELAQSFLAFVEDRRTRLQAIARTMPHQETARWSSPSPASSESLEPSESSVPELVLLGKRRQYVAVRSGNVAFRADHGATQADDRALKGSHHAGLPHETQHDTSELGMALSPSGISLQVARTFSLQGLPVPAWAGLLSLLEEFIWTWDNPDSLPGRHGDPIYQRDGWRCMAPGCTSRANLEDHHVLYRSRGGSDIHSNRVCICRFHHRLGEHRNLAQCRGTAPLGLVWSLGRSGNRSFAEDRSLPEIARYRNEIRIA